MSSLDCRVDVFRDDRGLSAAMDLASVKEEWRTAYLTRHGITTLDDYVYMVDGRKWEELVGQVVSLATNRIALARLKSAYELGAQALRQAASDSPKAGPDPDEVLLESATIVVPLVITYNLNLGWK